MNTTNFLETNIPHIENPNFTSPFLYSHMTNQDYTYNFQDTFLDQDFEFSSFLDHVLVDYVPIYNNSNSTPLLDINPTMHEISSSSTNSASSTTSFYATPPNINHLKEKSKVGIIKKNERHVIAFRTKTQLEILDDGYKWRKYGKKKVKSNTNYLRNYYKCKIQECEVKKRVERDGHDSSYLITTYEGKHNHEINSSIIYNHVETDSEFELNVHRGGKSVERDGHDLSYLITTYEG
ncbi:probable WRKY transcription factor 51 [Solanum pennellii]|uniref:Probable WRKY transcription factor 51 n=1 Tax=Solanum pennellii TaxID=28526 RepID=A0ABM1FR72_SOLPN|nr:probable WRKY transcription factor 51 [Solanum pennellii]